MVAGDRAVRVLRAGQGTRQHNRAPISTPTRGFPYFPKSGHSPTAVHVPHSPPEEKAPDQRKRKVVRGFRVVGVYRVAHRSTLPSCPRTA